MTRIITLAALGLAFWSHIALADIPRVVDAEIQITGGETARISVTVRHADTGWEHYADGWSVRLPDGTEIGYRTLHHPHVDEQPFTRSLGNLTIPEGTEALIIVPHDTIDGWGPPFTLSLDP